MLDTKLLSRLASGRKTESYWPVAVADNKFHCIILKGGDQYPYFPRPLISEFEFQIPLSSSYKKNKAPGGEDKGDGVGVGVGGEGMNGGGGGANGEEEDEEDERARLEEAFVQKSLDAALYADFVASASSTHTQRTVLARKEVEVDKTLLQMLAVECREGEERGMKALEMVRLMRDGSGRMVEAAGKIAERYGRRVLVEKIREAGERRMLYERMEMDE